MTNEPPIMDGTSSQSSHTQVFSCTECSYAFTSETFLLKHIKRSHNDLHVRMLRPGQILSPSCPQTTSIATRQIQGDTDKARSYAHQEPTKTLAQPEEVKTHRQTYTGKKAHICKKCDRSFSKSDDLKSHQCIHTGGKPSHRKQTYVPSQPQPVHSKCLEDEPQTLALSSRSSQTQVSDSECVFTLASQMYRDNMTNSLNNIYSQMLNRRELTQASYQKLASSVAKARFLEPYVSRSTSGDTTEQLQNGPGATSATSRRPGYGGQLQEGEANEPRPYSHQQFTKTSTQPGEAKTPERTKKKAHVCKQCDKSFSLLGDLKSHERSHTGEKPFHCSQCDKRFSHLTTLKSHQRIHTGEKPFQCKLCGKKFSHLTSLRSHQKIHTGEKSFHCRYCDKSFYHSGNLNRHERVHNNGEARVTPRPTPHPNAESNVTDAS